MSGAVTTIGSLVRWTRESWRTRLVRLRGGGWAPRWFDDRGVQLDRR